MRDATVRFIMQFSEHNSTEDWDERKYKVACFVAACWNLQSKERGWSEISQLSAEECHQWLDEWEEESFGDYEDSCKPFYIENYEFYGRITDTVEEMHAGMKHYFPDIDYEFECYIFNNGDAWEDVTIVEGGKRYDNGFTFYYLEDYLGDYDTTDEDLVEAVRNEVLARDIFQEPERTEENPYPVASGVLLDVGEPPTPIIGFWR